MLKASFSLPKNEIKATFKIPKNEIKATFSIKKVVPLEDLDFATNERVDNIVNDFTNDLDIIATELDNRYTKLESDNLLNNKQPLGDYAVKSDINLIEDSIDTISEEIIDLIKNKAEKYDTYTKGEVDAKISTIKVDAYTKTETNNLLSQKANQSDLNITKNNLDALTGDVENIAGELDSKANKSEIPTIPTNISYFNNDSGYVDNTYHDNTKQDVINDLDTIRSGASNGASAYTTIQGYGDIVTHNAIDFIPSSTTLLTITDVDNRINASTKFLKKNAADSTSGVITFNGGKSGSGSQPSLIATNGFYVGGYNVTGWADVTSHRLVNDKVNTGSYYIDGNGSVLFRHKTGTKTAEGSANDAMFTINPVTGIKAGWSGTAGQGITDSDLHDVLIDTVQYLTLQTTAKDIIGAINELKSRLDSLG